MNIRYPIYEGVYRILTNYCISAWKECPFSPAGNRHLTVYPEGTRTMTRGLSHPGSTVGRPLNREIHLAGDILSGLAPAPRIVSSIMVMSWGTPFTYRVAPSPEIRISRLPHERLIAFFSPHSSISYFSVSCFTFPFPTLLHSPVTHRISSSRIRPVPLRP